MGLQYATSAAIVTLLTIQNTKRATLHLAAKRLLSFGLTILLTYLIYEPLGYHAFSFGLVLLLLVAVSYCFGWQDAISVNAVIATHFLLEQDYSAAFVKNEAFFVLLGTIIAILLNTYMPDRAEDIRADIHEIENQIQKVLRQMADALLDISALEGGEAQLRNLEIYLEQGLERAFENRDNCFSDHTRYYIEYMEMRKSQCQVLKALLDSCLALTGLPSQARPISDFLRHTADSLHERNNVRDLVVQLEELLKDMRLEPLPQSRVEFENRAILFHMLLDLEEFLLIKREFVDAMTEEQVRIYWSREAED